MPGRPPSNPSDDPSATMPTTRIINTHLNIKNLPSLLTVREAAEILRVSPLTIKRWGKRGKLPAIRINTRGDRRYKRESILWLLGITEEEEDTVS